MKHRALIILMTSLFVFTGVKMFGGANFYTGSRITKISEEEKIKKLIEYVRTLKGAAFIRNGSNHTPEEAAKHLELKRKKAGSRVKTAIEFIAFCGSKSSTTGKDYMIKLSSGKMVKSLDLLTEQLKRIEKENQ